MTGACSSCKTGADRSVNVNSPHAAPFFAIISTRRKSEIFHARYRLRFHRDHAGSVRSGCCRAACQGFDIDRDLEDATLVEPEAVREALRLNKVAGAQCLVTSTAGITAARLAHHGLEEHAQEVVKAGLDIACQLSPSTCWWEVARAGCRCSILQQSVAERESQPVCRRRARMRRGDVRRVLLNGFANPSDLARTHGRSPGEHCAGVRFGRRGC